MRVNWMDEAGVLTKRSVCLFTPHFYKTVEDAGELWRLLHAAGLPPHGHPCHPMPELGSGGQLP